MYIYWYSSESGYRRRRRRQRGSCYFSFATKCVAEIASSRPTRNWVKAASAQNHTSRLIDCCVYVELVVEHTVKAFVSFYGDKQTRRMSTKRQKRRLNSERFNVEPCDVGRLRWLYCLVYTTKQATTIDVGRVTTWVARSCAVGNTGQLPVGNTIFCFDRNHCETRSTQRAQTSADPEDPDFGLWTPGSEAWSGSPPKLYHLVLEPCSTPPKKSSKSVHKFASNPTDRQTNRETNRPNQKHNLLLRRR